MNVEDLLYQLHHESDLDIRRYIPDKLAKLGDWSSTVPLGELIIDRDQPALLRNEAVESLGKQGDPRAVEYLRQVLDDEEDDIRRTAVWSLGQVGTPSAVQPVFSMTDDPWVETRRWVAKSAGRIRSDDVIPPLMDYLQKTPVSEERVLADIIRAFTSQIDRISPSNAEFLLEKCYNLIASGVRSYVKQAVMLLLNAFYSRGTSPRSEFLISIFSEIPATDPLVRPQIIEALGYAKEVSFLQSLDDPLAVRSLGIAQKPHLLDVSLASSSDVAIIIAALEGFTFTSELPDLDPYYNHENLTVRTQALQLHAMHHLDIKRVLEAYRIGQGRYKILEILRYYGKDALEIYRSSTIDGDKVARQASVHSLISEPMIRDIEAHEGIAELLLQVSDQDRIWHIRRDARIGLERIGRNYSTTSIG